mmetsp:Transcript_26660/g.64764  ORF Transcript_26660/g.64764 Transcript_26660/m.64764 type:complete len:429 (+) Transcript_26660:179-1465(+)
MAGGIAMGGNINIVGGEDEFARYKMPVIQGKVEGRGNGIKTRIVNCYEVGRALHRPPSYVCRFFGYELGAQTQINEAEGTYIVNGQHEQIVLAETLQKFINGFVLCTNCKLPETDIKVDKRQVIKQVCSACGHSEPVDMLHKLCTYIINNPPSSYDKGFRKKEKETTKEGKKGKKNRDSDGTDKKSKSKKGSKKEETEEERAERKARRRAEKEAAAAAAAAEKEDDDDNVVWATDTSAEAVAARRAEAEAAARLLEGAKIEMPIDKLIRGIGEGKGPESVARRARKLYESDPDKAICLVTEAYMRAPTDDKAKEVSGRIVAGIQALLKKMPEGNAWNKPLMESIDAMLEGQTEDCKAIKVVPFMLKALYDEELLAEEHIVAWYKSEAGNRNAVAARDGAATFVAWLETAEEAGSDEDDDEEEEESDDE